MSDYLCFMKPLLLFLITSIFWQCSPLRVVKPLEVGKTQAQVEYGGPIIEFGSIPIPMPLISLGLAHGYTEHTSIHGGLHLTSLAAANLHLDGGITRGFIVPEKWRPGLSGTLQADLILGFRELEFRIYPQANLNVYWQHGNHIPYISVGNWFDFFRGTTQAPDFLPGWIPVLHLGHRIERENWDIGIEIQYIGAFSDNREVVVSYANPFNYGAFGIYFLAAKNF